MPCSFHTFHRLLVCIGLTFLVTARASTTRASTAPSTNGHWAFIPPVDVSPPYVRQTGWARNGIDHFILATLESRGLKPAPPADPRTWIRRLSLDLLGLPPTEVEVQAFIKDFATDGPDALPRWVDRFLASPHYGERWGRHWLDLARYSDTKGYVYGREERRFIHSAGYRDWVIRSLNEDLPYNRFLQLQLAADALVSPGSPDLAALGFITLGRRFLGVTHDIIDDRIDTLTRTTLGLTVACARCHDHKYDPIPTADYYSLYGVFQATEDIPIPLQTVTDARAQELGNAARRRHTERLAEANARLRARIGDYLAAQFELHNYPEEGFEQILGEADLIPHSVRRWRDFLLRNRSSPEPMFAPWHRLTTIEAPPGPAFATAARRALDATPASTFHPRILAAFQPAVTNRQEVAARYAQAFRDAEAAIARHQTNNPAAPLPPDLQQFHDFLHHPESPTTVPDSAIVNIEYYLPTPVCEELNKLRADVDRRWIEIGLPAAVILRDRPHPANPRVFRRGSPAQAGAEVHRQFLSILAGPGRQPFQHGSGRQELAEAITDSSNPLTARVLVNRVWQQHFGRGLVSTPSDFGLRASPPSHPALLDWLALRFQEQGWSLKQLHRLIVLSATYGMAHRPPPDADPEHRLLSAFPGRRMDFEQLRDSMLHASGELDATRGGTAIELLAPTNHRRSVYGLVDRQFLPGVLRTFDFANPDLHVAVRHETTVPQQGLFFLNGPFAAARARQLAAELPEGTPSDRVTVLHRRIFQRLPTPAEMQAGLRFLGEAPGPAKSTQASPWSYGTGELDEQSGRLRGFKALPVFTGTAWQGAGSLPGGESGWAQLTAAGGHPGNTRAWACVRRWTAPRQLTVNLEGTVRHEPREGDGIRAFIVSSRQGILASAKLHNTSRPLHVQALNVEPGETLDFLVDVGDGLGYDQFLWSPRIQSGPDLWDSQSQFSGPGQASEPLDAWAQYAQVLLLTNEFAFID